MYHVNREVGESFRIHGCVRMMCNVILTVQSFYELSYKRNESKGFGNAGVELNFYNTKWKCNKIKFGDYTYCFAVRVKRNCKS